MVADTLTRSIESALRSAGYEARAFTLEHPSNVTHGDFSTNAALVAAKATGGNSRELAEVLVKAIEKPEAVERMDIAGPGFINFHLSREFFAQSVAGAREAGEAWGRNDRLGGKRIMVEHTQPNPFKPFHIGHLMSNTLGESLSRVIAFSGAEVKRANWQGDVGLHVAKALWGMGVLGVAPEDVEGIGKAYALGHEKYENDAEAKKEIGELNKKVYARDPEILDTYTRGREASLAHFEELYALLGTHFDHYFFESEGVTPGKAMVAEGLKKGVFEESDGAVVYRGEKHGLHTRVFLTHERLPTYEAKELGLAQLKEAAWEFDESITTTAVEQTEYFKVVFAALGALRPELAAKMRHVSHGMMQLTSGKMSSRKGNIISGESLLHDMQTLVLEKMQARDFSEKERGRIAGQVAVAALKYEILKQKKGKNIRFDPDRALSLEGDSGPYLQYTYTRAASVLAKAREMCAPASSEEAPNAVTALERLLYRFPEVVVRALEEYEPHHITGFLLSLAGEFNAWYAKERILGSGREEKYRLALTEVVAVTLKNGLWLLGIEAPERM